MNYMKDPASTSNNDGAIVEWLMHFWSPGAFDSRWSAKDRALIRDVTCRILQPSDVPGDASLTELWRMDGIDSTWVNIQTGLDILTPGRLYMLELDLPEGSKYRSDGPAGPATGRGSIEDLPPWLDPFDSYDYQVRPARFWFDVEDAPGSGPKAKRILAMHDDEDDTAWRPTPARHHLRPDPAKGYIHVDIDWRPDWLRRGRRRSGRSMNVDIIPSGAYPIHGGAPTHIVLHSIGVSQGTRVSNIGSAINTFLDATDKGGIHYIIDVDGHVVKMCPETRGLAHSNQSSWRDKTGLNRRSVGIEHAYAGQPDVHPKAQLRATVDLLRALKSAFGIDGRNIAGHGEVRCISDSEASDSTAIQADEADRTAAQQQRVTELQERSRAKWLAKNEAYERKGQLEKVRTPAQIEERVVADLEVKNLDFEYEKRWGLALHPNSRLVSCPGTYFDWSYLAARGVVPEAEALSIDWKTAYSGIFDFEIGIALQVGDDDSAQTWGKKTRPDFSGLPIRELYDDMKMIGYPIPVEPTNQDGTIFSEFLKHAIKAFKARHMQTKSTKANNYGMVDVKTAETIKRVAAAYARGPV